MNIKHMTPEEKHQMAFDWIQENAPDYVLKYADHLDSVRAKAEASADSAGAAIKSQGEYINKLYSEREDLRAENARLTAQIEAMSGEIADAAALNAELNRENNALLMELQRAQNEASPQAPTKKK